MFKHKIVTKKEKIDFLMISGRFDTNPFDWEYLSNNSTRSLISMCHQLQIPIRPNMIKSELISLISSSKKIQKTSSRKRIFELQYPSKENEIEVLNRVKKIKKERIEPIIQKFSVDKIIQNSNIDHKLINDLIGEEEENFQFPLLNYSEFKNEIFQILKYFQNIWNILILKEPTSSIEYSLLLSRFFFGFTFTISLFVLLWNRRN